MINPILFSYSCIVMDRRSFAKGIPSRSDGPKTVVDVNVYLAERRLDVCDEQVEHGGMFWPQTLKVSQSVIHFLAHFALPVSLTSQMRRQYLLGH